LRLFARPAKSRSCFLRTTMAQHDTVLLQCHCIMRDSISAARVAAWLANPVPTANAGESQRALPDEGPLSDLGRAGAWLSSAPLSDKVAAGKSRAGKFLRCGASSASWGARAARRSNPRRTLPGSSATTSRSSPHPRRFLPTPLPVPAGAALLRYGQANPQETRRS
jgi:hypothetical protein